MKKRALAFFLCIALCGALFSPCIPTARAAESIANGTCGENLTWALDSDGVLTISGTGAMAEYENEFEVPWHRYRSQITSVNLPEGLTRIDGSLEFYGCSSLTGIWVDANNSTYSNDENGVFFNKDKTVLIRCPGGFSGAYVIPAGVTRIRYEAFRDCIGLTSISIPASVTSIEWEAFDGCASLTNISIPANVTYIGWSVFSGCSGLTSVSIPSSVTSIEADTFSGCTGLTSISIPSSVTSINWGAFFGCTGLSGVTIPEGVISIEGFAFANCTGLTNVSIPSSVTSIITSAFSECSSLTGIWVDADNTAYCNDENGVLFNKEKTILICCPGGFSGAYIIPAGVTSIRYTAFRDCTGLTSVIFPETLTEIGDDAFLNCMALTGAYFYGDAPQLGQDCFCYYAEESEETSTIAKIPGLTLYYMPGRSGWTLPTYGEEAYPTATWDGVISHTHQYEETVIAPTCTEQGYTRHTCVCGDSYEDSYVPALGHSFENGACIRCGAADPAGACDGGAACPGHDFADMPGASNWAHKGLDFCIARGLLSGTSDTTVSPNVTMNRAMLVTVLYSLEGKPEVTAENPFTDVENDRWFSKPVIWAAANGIVSGAGNGKFNPFGNVTREQIAVMLRSYARYKSFDTSASVELSNYPDAESTSGWAKDALSWAVAEGLISGAASGGATYLNPKNNATRAQVATILMQFVTKVAND